MTVAQSVYARFTSLVQDNNDIDQKRDICTEIVKDLKKADKDEIQVLSDFLAKNELEEIIGDLGDFLLQRDIVNILRRMNKLSGGIYATSTSWPQLYNADELELREILNEMNRKKGYSTPVGVERVSFEQDIFTALWADFNVDCITCEAVSAFFGWYNFLDKHRSNSADQIRKNCRLVLGR